MREYDQVCPGLAERIITLAESEATHRRKIEKDAVTADSEYMRGCLSGEKRGQILAVLITVSLAGIGAYLTMNGHDTAGATIGVSGVAGIVTSLITGRNKVPEPKE